MLIRRLPVAVAAFALSVAMLLAGPAAADISRLMIFGDSLSDTGNTSIATFGIVPGSPYFDGRFSNGPVWVEHLASSLQVPVPTPSRTGGTNYAHGGAETGGGNTQFIIPNIGTQISGYVSSGPAALPDDLFIVFGGGNDFINGDTNVTGVVNNMVNHVTTLANNGGTQFLVPNLPLLGQVPDYRGTSSEAQLDQLSMDFNAQLATALDGLEVSLGVTIYRVDTSALFADILAAPGDFGFTNATDPAYDEATGQIVPNPDEYVFWDGLHPTTVAHGVFADVALGELIAVPGDATGDGVVDVQDLLEVILAWGLCPDPPASCPADVNDDGMVDVLDLVDVILNWS